MHPSTRTAVAALDFRHLSPTEELAARPFAELALVVADNPQNQGPEAGANTTAAIRHLAEAQALILANARAASNGEDAQLVAHQMRQALGLL